MSSYALPDRLRRTGITYRQVDYWIRRGWLHPGRRQYVCPDPDCKHPSTGSGVPREWTNDELDVAVRMAQLVKAGIAPEVAAKAAREGTEAWLSPRVKVVIAS